MKLPGLAGNQSNIVQAIRDASNEWNKAAWFTFYSDTASCDSPSNDCWDAGDLGNLGPFAVTTYTQSGRILSNSYVKFNTRYVWHLDGTDPDIFEVALHEFGHMLDLDDNPSFTWGGSQQAVMWYSGKRGLYIDDKEGDTMLYGPWTQFEISQYLGLYQTLPFYMAEVHSFGNCGSGYPDYWTYDRSAVGIPSSPNGGRVMQFRGCAVSNGSSPNYAYMPFATSAEDSNGATTTKCGDTCYLNIQPGMMLSWQQYNVTQCTVTIDLEFSDGTTLRDSGLRDTFGYSVHPQFRPCFSGWQTFTVNLAPSSGPTLVGKTIRRILVAYDNPNGSGTWRSYFDDLRVSY